ncbi:IS3 family transposase [Cytobacillus oceanisediminis]|uniref:IS3 family transposase n=1 Tax=Cytobacillus oceanisediminis TaxID=665099 RepID=UPI000D710988
MDKGIRLCGAVPHSDQRFQYTSKLYNSRKGNCLDNASVESFFPHLKTEKLYMGQFNSDEEQWQAIDDYIYYYNYKRRKNN